VKTNWIHVLVQTIGPNSAQVTRAWTNGVATPAAIATNSVTYAPPFAQPKLGIYVGGGFGLDGQIGHFATGINADGLLTAQQIADIYAAMKHQ
jgi:hypothetical protein